MNTPKSLLSLCLCVPGALFAQAPVPVASTVVFSKPSTAATYVAANAGATLVKAENQKLTFQKTGNTFSAVYGNGLTYQLNGAWTPSQLRVAALNDGTGWAIQAVPINVSLTGKPGQDKDLSLVSGSVTMNLDVPQLNYNGDDTFSFKEGSTTWILRVAEASVSIEATVAQRAGKAPHKLGYNSLGAALTVDAKGTLHIGGQVHLTRPVLGLNLLVFTYTKTTFQVQRGTGGSDVRSFHF